MDETVLPSKLLTVLHTAAEHIRGHDFIHIYSHHDADGVSAAGILACMLQRLGKEYQVTLVPILNDAVFEEMDASLSDCILMSDLGASYIDRLEDIVKDVIVLDHHYSDLDSEAIVYANPHLYGIDGMTSGCGATMAFLLSIIMDQNNWDLVQLAFAGIAGDRQHINGLKGLNALIIDEAESKGYITRTEGSLVPLGPLSNSLFISTEPYIKGISGSIPGVQNLLKDARIPNNLAYRDLTDEQRWRLSSMIAIKLLEQGVEVGTLEETARTRYLLRDWNMDAEALADLLNACGRTDIGGVGVGLCLGDETCLELALRANRATKDSVIAAMANLEKIGLTQMEHIQFFDNNEKGFTGILCSVAMQFLGDRSKPTVGINVSDENAKISTRGTWAQLDRGIDLSAAMKAATESVGGTGGGHRIASGGSISRDKESEFLLNLDRIIGEQLSNAM